LRSGVRGFGSTSQATAASYTASVMESDIQIVSNEAGEATAVIVPIALWREIASERETAYLLQSDRMRQPLLTALKRESGVPIEDSVAKLGL
jgi:antitoxin YefM